MSMRAELVHIVAAGAASISEGVQEPHEVVDEILNALMNPTESMFDGISKANIDLKNEWPMSRGIFRSMIAAAKAGK